MTTSNGCKVGLSPPRSWWKKLKPIVNPTQIMVQNKAQDYSRPDNYPSQSKTFPKWPQVPQLWPVTGLEWGTSRKSCAPTDPHLSLSSLCDQQDHRSTIWPLTHGLGYLPAPKAHLLTGFVRSDEAIPLHRHFKYQTCCWCRLIPHPNNLDDEGNLRARALLSLPPLEILR